MKRVGLSKSKIISGLQCEKKLYMETYSPELGVGIDSVAQARMDEGTDVGVLARTRFPGGVLIAEDYKNLEAAIATTEKQIKAGALVLFEATFSIDSTLVRVDILKRESTKKAWDIVEVKSSSRVKDVHYDDVAVQYWALKECGLKVGKCFVMYLNNKCVFPDLDDLFAMEDVTKEVKALSKSLSKDVKNLKSLLTQNEVPQIKIGPHCDSPYECGFKEHCFEKSGVSSPSIFELPGLGQKAWNYFDQGIVSLRDDKALDLIKSKGFKENQARALDAVRKNALWIDTKAIFDSIKQWKWPLYFLDFETFGPAIPRYTGTRPYEQIPFQFSCHVLERIDSEPKHIEFLHTDSRDPRPFVAKALSTAIGDKGSIVAYNQSVEKNAVTRLADCRPEYAEQFNSWADRFVDPWPVIKNSVYAPEFKGSFSIKSVAPALLGKDFSYSEMDVGGGQEAQLGFAKLILNEISTAERNSLIKAMLEYCKQDTLAMMKVVQWLFSKIHE